MTNSMRMNNMPVIHAKDIITLTARLAQLLAEEVDMLGEMKVSKIKNLQEEKLFLIQALETQKKILTRHPELSETIPSRDKRDLEEVIEVFNGVLEENHRRLQMAREVNQQVVRAIREVVTDNAVSKSYNSSGTKHIASYESMSITLNQAI